MMPPLDQIILSTIEVVCGTLVIVLPVLHWIGF